MLILIRISP